MSFWAELRSLPATTLWGLADMTHAILDCRAIHRRGEFDRSGNWLVVLLAPLAGLLWAWNTGARRACQWVDQRVLRCDLCDIPKFRSPDWRMGRYAVCPQCR